MHLHVAKNVFYQLISRLVTAFTGFVVTIVIARYFGASSYGDYTKITATVALFYLFVDFGLNAIYLQEDSDHSHFKDLFYSRTLLSFLLTVLLGIIVFFLPFNVAHNSGFSPTVKLGIIFYSTTIIFQAIQQSALAVFQKSLAYQKLVGANVIGSIIILLFALYAAYASISLNMLILLLSVGSGVSAFASLLFAHKKLTPLSIDIQFVKKLFVKSVPLGLMLVFNLVYFRIDSILLSFLKSSQDVGVYGLAYRFFDFLIALPLFFSNALYPKLLESSKNFRNLNQILRFYVFLYTIISVCLIFGCFLMSPLFSYIKPEFANSVLPFRILSLSLPLFFFTSLLQWILITLKKNTYLVYVYGGCALLNIVLNFIFIPSYSYVASAVITGISEAVVLLCLLWKYRELSKSYD